MKLQKIGNNETLIKYDNGVEVLFSYNTPVAGYRQGKGYFKTSQYYSKTTSKHITRYLGDFKNDATLMSEFEISQLSSNYSGV